MSYVQNHLMPGENIVFQTKLSWTQYIKGIITIIIGYLLVDLEGIGIFIICVGVLMLIWTFLKIKTSEFAVTDKRVLIKVGILKTRSLETNLQKVEGIHVNQGIIGKMFNSGTITVMGTGGTNNPFSNIDKPYELRSAVNAEVSKYS